MFYSLTWWDLIPFPFLVLGIRAILFRRVAGQDGNKEGAGYMALYSIIYMVMDIIRHRTGYAVMDAGFSAYWIYEWWRCGGGDGIKKFIDNYIRQPIPVKI